MREPSSPAVSTSPSAQQVGRRSLLMGGAVAGTSTLLPSRLAGAAPEFVRACPAITHGIQSGDVSASRAVVWARSDRPVAIPAHLVEGDHDPPRPRKSRSCS